jgi:hypothetical protein
MGNAAFFVNASHRDRREHKKTAPTRLVWRRSISGVKNAQPPSAIRVSLLCAGSLKYSDLGGGGLPRPENRRGHFKAAKLQS